jgi:hypothetical protein
MKTNEQPRHGTWKFLRRVAALFHGRFPTWAVWLLVLFGSGGVFYTAYDYIKKQHPASNPVYDGPPSLPVSIDASFFPNYQTGIPAGVSVEITNYGRSTIPNLKLALDSGSASLQSCETRTSDNLLSAPEKTSDSIFVANLRRLLPNERVQIYCLAESPHQIGLTLNSVDSEGRSLGSFSESLARSAGTMDSGFETFLWILAGTILSAAGLSVIYIIFGIAGRLVAWLKLFPEK